MHADDQPATGLDPWVMVAAVQKRKDASEVVYALGLRSIDARSVGMGGIAGAKRAFAIEVRKSSEPAARRALPYVWDGMLDVTRAQTDEGRCPFCKYDLTGLPADAPCPECGVDLNSADARLRARDLRGRPPAS